ncbi:hypothetical protein GGI12_005103 [Dipsacomyces acuminosporus]|nr:hypothetical protein GGI12_005103 [Dipsacomyces acuminosporus]
MDEFIDAVDSQVIELSHLDVIAQTVNIQFVYVYENKKDAADFMPFDELKQAFYKALQQFPSFVGHLKEVEKNKFSVIVDTDNLNMPGYRQSASDMHYSELKAANFSWDKWPKEIELSPLVKIDTAGGIRNVNIHVVRLEGNSGVVISLEVAHYLVDGVGYFEFVNLWASICKEMRQGGTDFAKLHKTLDFDRGVLKANLPEKSKPLGGTIRELFTRQSLISTCFAWLPWVKRMRLVVKLMKLIASEAHMFHISRESLDQMHQSVKEFIPSGTRISDNDLLSALLAMTYAQSERPANPAGKKSSQSKLIAGRVFSPLKKLLACQKEKDILFGIACDARPRLGITDKNFMGNSPTGLLVRFKPLELTAPTAPESLAANALRVRQYVNTVDATYVVGLLDMLDKCPKFYTNFCAALMRYSIPGQSNHTRFNMYTADFGDGVNQWISFVPGLKYNAAMIQPCPPGVDGVNIFVEASTKVMKNILANGYWNSVAELIY